MSALEVVLTLAWWAALIAVIADDARCAARQREDGRRR